MARRGTVLEFRRPRQRYVAPGPIRGNKLRFSQRRLARTKALSPAGGLALWTALCLLLLAGVMIWERQVSPGAPAILAAVPEAQAAPPSGRYIPDPVDRPAAAIPASASLQPVSIRWADGDSGWINGKAFRLYGVDAPEGSPSRAKCHAEWSRSSEARNAAVSLTSRGEVGIKSYMGKDRFDRDLVQLSVDGRDVASTLVGSGHLQLWAYEAGQVKPDWCG